MRANGWAADACGYETRRLPNAIHVGVTVK